MTEESTFKSRLETIHTFPTLFTAKAIGENSSDFIKSITKVSHEVLPDSTEPSITSTPSSKEKYISLKITFMAPDADTVIHLYEALGKIEGLKFLT